MTQNHGIIIVKQMTISMYHAVFAPRNCLGRADHSLSDVVKTHLYDESIQMPLPSTEELVYKARQAGYQIAEVQQVRANRWLLTLKDSNDATLLVLVQARPLIISADVQDLAELVRLRRGTRGLLWAYDGSFSSVAQRTLTELSDTRLRFCTTLPPAAQLEGEDLVKVSAALRPTP
jgi:hypothetical protein